MIFLHKQLTELEGSNHHTLYVILCNAVYGLVFCNAMSSLHSSKLKIKTPVSSPFPPQGRIQGAGEGA